MLNAIKIDIHRTFRGGKIFYLLFSWLICIGVMALQILVLNMFRKSTYSFSNLVFAGFHGGVFAIGLCLFIIAVIMVDYEYGNVKNICSVTGSRSTFIIAKLIYAYFVSLISAFIGAGVLIAAGCCIFRGHVVPGNIGNLLLMIVGYSFAADVPITIVAIFSLILKRASYCSYVVIALYVVPGIVTSIVHKNLGIDLANVSVLQFVFEMTGKYRNGIMLQYGLLGLLYTVVLFAITRQVAGRRDVL